MKTSKFYFSSKEDVERCKQKDLIAEMLAQMTGDFPKLYEIIVKERDAYLARSLRLAAIPREVTDPDGGMVYHYYYRLLKSYIHYSLKCESQVTGKSVSFIV